MSVLSHGVLEQFVSNNGILRTAPPGVFLFKHPRPLAAWFWFTSGTSHAFPYVIVLLLLLLEGPRQGLNLFPLCIFIRGVHSSYSVSQY